MKLHVNVIVLIAVFLAVPISVFAADFEELDKPPEGIYKGQRLAGGYIALGIPFGSAIKAEKKFVKGSTYTFTDSDTTKSLWLTHLSFALGVYGEYLPMEYIGIYGRIGAERVVQRTNFGRNFSNKRSYLYKGYSIMLGPNFHATNRKPWDVSLAPLIGYTFGTYHATPIADRCLQGYNPSHSKNRISTFIYGVEMRLSIFFSGGFIMSLSGEWVRIPVKLSKPIAEQNTQTGRRFMNGGKSGNIDNIRLVLGIGYAFKN
jgi:hypothetical protein